MYTYYRWVKNWGAKVVEKTCWKRKWYFARDLHFLQPHLISRYTFLSDGEGLSWRKGSTGEKQRCSPRCGEITLKYSYRFLFLLQPLKGLLRIGLVAGRAGKSVWVMIFLRRQLTNGGSIASFGQGIIGREKWDFLCTWGHLRAHSWIPHLCEGFADSLFRGHIAQIRVQQCPDPSFPKKASKLNPTDLFTSIEMWRI